MRRVKQVGLYPVHVSLTSQRSRGLMGVWAPHGVPAGVMGRGAVPLTNEPAIVVGPNDDLGGSKAVTGCSSTEQAKCRQAVPVALKVVTHLAPAAHCRLNMQGSVMGLGAGQPGVLPDVLNTSAGRGGQGVQARGSSV